MLGDGSLGRGHFLLRAHGTWSLWELERGGGRPWRGLWGFGHVGGSWASVTLPVRGDNNATDHMTALCCCCGLNICVPSNSSVEAITPNAMVFGGGLWEVIGLDEVTRVKPPDRISVLMRGETREWSLCECTEKSHENQRGGGGLQVRKPALARH